MCALYICSVVDAGYLPIIHVVGIDTSKQAVVQQTLKRARESLNEHDKTLLDTKWPTILACLEEHGQYPSPAHEMDSTEGLKVIVSTEWIQFYKP